MKHWRGVLAVGDRRYSVYVQAGSWSVAASRCICKFVHGGGKLPKRVNLNAINLELECLGPVEK